MAPRLACFLVSAFPLHQPPLYSATIMQPLHCPKIPLFMLGSNTSTSVTISCVNAYNLRIFHYRMSILRTTSPTFSLNYSIPPLLFVFAHSFVCGWPSNIQQNLSAGLRCLNTSPPQTPKYPTRQYLLPLAKLSKG